MIGIRDREEQKVSIQAANRNINISFSAAENWFLRNFLDKIQPSCWAPSHYVRGKQPRYGNGICGVIMGTCDTRYHMHVSIKKEGRRETILTMALILLTLVPSTSHLANPIAVHFTCVSKRCSK
jgi:hypothetical protein